MEVFQAGYIIESLVKKLEKEFPNSKSLWPWLTETCIEKSWKSQPIPSNIQISIAKVLSNQISRGVLTRMTLDLEKKFFSSFELGSQKEEDGNLSFDPDENIANNLGAYFQALHLIDPRLDLTRLNYDSEGLASGLEEDFVFKFVASKFPFFSQILQKQRYLNTIIAHSNEFRRQRVDFSIEFPYSGNNQAGMIIEIDGSQHEELTQAFLDAKRDDASKKEGWRVVRKTNNGLSWENLPKGGFGYLNCLKENFYDKEFSKERTDVLQVTLSPFAIAKVQKTILKAILEGVLDLNKTTWKIIVLERDIPCAFWAIEDLKNQFQLYSNLTGSTSFPEIEVKVFTSTEFQCAKLQTQAALNLASFNNERLNADLIIDISMWRRPNVVKEESLPSHIPWVRLRSCHQLGEVSPFLTDAHIKYGDFSSNDWKNNKVELLEKVLQNLFRKQGFRPGQLSILQRALNAQSVIGLLPTGGGKSLTYQLAALLQPGICLVVDPIKSLMKDQVDGLAANFITSAIAINSTLNTKERGEALEELKQGMVLFAFISPERFQIKEFRDILGEMQKAENYFNYCVIDEAHCVSEWGHDFRTSYLRLGENAINFCKAKNTKSIPLFGLTATASFDVLADVQRELSTAETPLGDEAVKRFENSNRAELQFKIINVEANCDEKKDFRGNRKAVGIAKQNELRDFLPTLPQELKTVNDEAGGEKLDFEEFDNFWETSHGGIIFCPHRTGFFGVTDSFKPPSKDGNVSLNGVKDKLTGFPAPPIGIYMGSGDSNLQKRIEDKSIDCQDKFKEGKIKLLVATKAFGMGIDKSDVRYTIHINHPSSIEGFVQESGRAGRDKKTALCVILYNKQAVINKKIKGEERLITIDEDLMHYFHNKSFKGKDKEKAVLFNLLDEISYPNLTKKQVLANEIYTEMGLEVKANTWSDYGLVRLYVDIGGQKGGFVDLIDLSYKTQNKNDSEQNEYVLKYIVNFLKKYIPDLDADQRTEWLNKRKKEKPILGIEKQLAKKAIGASVDLVIGFTNDKEACVEKLKEVLKETFNRDIDTEKIEKAIGGSLNSLEEELKNSYQINFDNLTDNQLEKIKKAQFAYRCEEDTAKAIYRLSLLGLIDDYTIDYNAKAFLITVSKKHPKTYESNLLNYIKRYYSANRADSEMLKLNDFEEKTELRKCLSFLIDFIYEEIEKKRFQAISSMREACEEGLRNGNKAFKEFIDLYFNSKYSRKGYEVNDKNASLADRTTEGREQNLDWVWEFMEIVNTDPSGSQIDNLKHLLGACNRLLVSFPDNGTLLLLKAYARYILEADKLNEEQINLANDDFLHGLRSFKLSEKQTVETYKKFKKLVLLQNDNENIRQIIDQLEGLLFLSDLFDSIQNFNKKFLNKFNNVKQYHSTDF